MRLTRRGLAAAALLLPGAACAQARGAGGAAGLVTAPTMPCADRPGDIVGLLLEGTGAPGASILGFGQAFRPGDLPRGAALGARLADGTPLRVQADIKTRHADGSARIVLVALAAPPLTEGGTAGVVLTRDGAPPGPAFDAAPILARRSAILHLADRRFDLLAALRHGLAQGAWRRGPLWLEGRVEQPVPLRGVTSLRLVADVALRADGEMRVDLWLRNDGAMQPGGGAVGYAMRLLIDGREALAAEIPRQHQYTGWGRLVATGAPPPFPRHDAAYLAEAGATPRYDLTTGVQARLLNQLAARTATPAWAAPLGARHLAQQMGQSGGRPDIGPMTQSQAAWLQTGDPRAAAYAMGQAEAAGSIPWHVWDTAEGRWLDTQRWPRLWTDPRGGTPPRGLAQPIPGDTGWTLAPSHQPDLNTLPWLLTGRRACLDELLAQSAWCVAGRWPLRRGEAGRPGLAEGVNLVRGNQVRSAAWLMRQVGNAAWAGPDGNPTVAWLRQVEAANWAWLHQQIPAWTRAQGEAHGWIPGEYGEPGMLPPWQQDYFASSAAAAARRGQADARAVLGWMENFLAGRFLAAAEGFPPHDGAAYLLAVNADPEARAPLRSWSAIAAAMREKGISNGEGWRRSQGDYAQLALQSLAALSDVTGSVEARRAYGWLVEAGAPYTAIADYQRNPAFNITPRDRPRRPGLRRGCR